MKTYIDLEGDLYNSNHELIRVNYAKHHRDIRVLADVKATLRAGANSTLGGYPIYFITHDGCSVSFDSVRENFHEVVDAFKNDHRNVGWYIVGCQINYEDDYMVCEHSGERIPHAFENEEEFCED